MTDENFDIHNVKNKPPKNDNNNPQESENKKQTKSEEKKDWWTLEKIVDEIYKSLMETVDKSDNITRKYQEHAKKIIYRIPVANPAPKFMVSLDDLDNEIKSRLSDLEPGMLDKVIKEAVSRIFEETNKNYFPRVRPFFDWEFEYDYDFSKDTDASDTNLNLNEKLLEKRVKINQLRNENESLEDGDPDNNEDGEKIDNDTEDYSHGLGVKKIANNNTKEITEINLDLIKTYVVEIFVDQYKEPHAAVCINNRFEILSLNSTRFKNFIYKIWYENTGKINTDKIEGMIKILKADATFSGNIKNLQLRVAKTDDYTFYYDLTNSIGSMIKITPDGWLIIEKDLPILFKRYTNQKAQVTPTWTMDDKDDIFDKFIDLLNVKDESNKLLLKCYIVSLFIPDIVKPILILHGEQGSAKSTLQELIKMLVDPSVVLTLSIPKDLNEFNQQLSHNYISFYDNISNLPIWMSDGLCRAATGSGSSKRQLYTDDDDIIYTFKRCTGLNGINLEATKADLLDRSIIIQLDRISKDKRKKINEIWEEFDKIVPKLLGYILNIVVKVLQFKQTGKKIEFQELPRMADFAEIGEIIARHMGYPENEFITVYFDNINVQIDEAIEASPTSIAVINLLEKNESWIGTATELKTALDEIATDVLKINIEKNRLWSKSPNQLSSRLNEIKTNLREKGIEIEKYKENGKRMIKITKASSFPSNRPETENQIQIGGNILDDTVTPWTTE